MLLLEVPFLMKRSNIKYEPSWQRKLLNVDFSVFYHLPKRSKHFPALKKKKKKRKQGVWFREVFFFFFFLVNSIMVFRSSISLLNFFFFSFFFFLHRFIPVFFLKKKLVWMFYFFINLKFISLFSHARKKKNIIISTQVPVMY